MHPDGTSSRVSQMLRTLAKCIGWAMVVLGGFSLLQAARADGRPAGVIVNVVVLLLGALTLAGLMLREMRAWAAVGNVLLMGCGIYIALVGPAEEMLAVRQSLGAFWMTAGAVNAVTLLFFGGDKGEAAAKGGDRWDVS